MKIAALLTRHRRLLALCGLSALAHLLVLELVAEHGAGMRPAPPAGDALRLRLVTAPLPAAGEQAAASAPAERPALPARPARRPRTAAVAPARPASAPSPAGSAPAAAAAAAAAAMPAAAMPAAATPSSAAPPSPAAPAAPAASASQAAGSPLVQMPSRYRVRMPDAVRLGYVLTQERPGAPPRPAGQALLDWRSDGEHYTLALDGVLGRLHSEGGSSDAGIAPHRAREEDGGTRRETEFDAERHRILFHATGASVDDAEGAQDRASVLMQLAGIGLGEPDQIRTQAGEEIRIVVAGGDGAGIARYRVMGEENVDTALGSLSAWRLAEVVPAGARRLEIWLAPQQGWLPVRLRVIEADGSSATQTLARIEPGLAR